MGIKATDKMKAREGDSYNLNNTHKKLHWEGNLNKGLEEGRWATSIDIRDSNLLMELQVKTLGDGLWGWFEK